MEVVVELPLLERGKSRWIQERETRTAWKGSTNTTSVYLAAAAAKPRRVRREIGQHNGGSKKKKLV